MDIMFQLTALLFFVQCFGNIRTSEILHCINKIIMCLPSATGRTKPLLNCFCWPNKNIYVGIS